MPGCPDWTAADLLWHLARVQWFWASIDPDPARRHRRVTMTTSRRAGAAHVVRRPAGGVRRVLRGAGRASCAAPTRPSPRGAGRPSRRSGFTYRRQAHEALIHRLDAEQTAGQVTPLDPALAADGVDECLDVMFGGAPPWGEFAPLPHYVRVDLTDRDESLWVQIGRFTGTDPDGEHHDLEDIRVVPAPGGEADAVVSGAAGALDAWLWRRGDDSQVRVSGDLGVYDRFRLAVDQPIT